MSSSDKELKVRVAARSSLLSRKQVEELYKEIQLFYPNLVLDPHFVEAYGDKDLKTPLRASAPDFFTKEIDEMVLTGRCDMALHSAKDMPSDLPEGLELIAITEGVDPSDCLVFREGESLATLPKNALVGISCARREQSIALLNPDFICKEIRGTIDKRLALLQEGHYDAVVMAEAALIRLNLTHLPRIILEGPVHPLQGKLGIVSHKNNHTIKEIFAVLDRRMQHV